MTKIRIQCKPDENYVGQIRGLFCRESLTKNEHSRNPLIETNFNELLDNIVQTAFEEGLNFKWPKDNLIIFLDNFYKFDYYINSNEKETLILRRNNIAKQWQLEGEHRYILNPEKGKKPEEIVEEIFEVHTLKKGVLAIYNRNYIDIFNLQII